METSSYASNGRHSGYLQIACAIGNHALLNVLLTRQCRGLIDRFGLSEPGTGNCTKDGPTTNGESLVCFGDCKTETTVGEWGDYDVILSSPRTQQRKSLDLQHQRSTTKHNLSQHLATTFSNAIYDDSVHRRFLSHVNPCGTVR